MFLQYRELLIWAWCWDPTTMQARMSPAQIESILTSVKRVREGRSLTVKQFQKLLGLMSAVSNVIPFGLLYMRPLQWWLKTKGFSPKGNPLCIWSRSRGDAYMHQTCGVNPWFLSQGLVLGAPCRCGTLGLTHSTLKVYMAAIPRPSWWPFSRPNPLVTHFLQCWAQRSLC